MKEILLTILGVIVFILIVIAILFHKHIGQLRKMLKQAAEAREARRIAEEEEYFKRTLTKNYRKEEQEVPKFKDDYFKRSSEETPHKKPQQETTARRTTQTDSGVTIIDDRGNHQTDRKIFDDNEGEYVEFEEV